MNLRERETIDIIHNRKPLTIASIAFTHDDEFMLYSYVTSPYKRKGGNPYGLGCFSTFTNDESV